MILLSSGWNTRVNPRKNLSVNSPNTLVSQANMQLGVGVSLSALLSLWGIHAHFPDDLVNLFSPWWRYDITF